MQPMVHPDRAPQVKDHQDSQGPMGESSGMCPQGCRSLVPSGPCCAASTMEKLPGARAVSAQRGCQDICTIRSPAAWGTWGSKDAYERGRESLSWGPNPPTSQGHAGKGNGWKTLV